MTTKKAELYLNQLSSNTHSHSDNYNQFTNFNLNQGHKCSSEFHVQTFNKSNKVKHFATVKPDYTVKDNYQEKRKSWNKTSNNLNYKPSMKLNLMAESQEEGRVQKLWKNDSNISNVNSSSTLSLHIAAYENSDPASNDDLSKTFKASKFVEPTFQDSLEFPRQMNDKDAPSTPQIMQFKASQKLLSPNQGHAGIPMVGNITECFICCKLSDLFGVGKCCHPICMECSIMLRVLDKSETCPQCRFPIKTLYFVSAPSSWENFNLPSTEISHPDCQKYGLKFTSDYAVTAYNSYMIHSCSICAKIGSKIIFPSFAALKNHMEKIHSRTFCSLCDGHLHCLSRNRVPYTSAEMERHLKGTNNEASGQRGHPMCWICNERFFDDDLLNRHFKAEHFFCQLCENNGTTVSFGSTPELYQHYSAEHFPCDSIECQHMGIVFPNEIELELHKAEEHGFSLRNLAAFFTGRSNQSTPRGGQTTPQREAQPLAAIEPSPSSTQRNTGAPEIRTSMSNLARGRPSSSSQASTNTSVRTAILNVTPREPQQRASPSSELFRTVRNISSTQSVPNRSQRSSASQTSQISQNRAVSIPRIRASDAAPSLPPHPPRTRAETSTSQASQTSNSDRELRSAMPSSRTANPPARIMRNSPHRPVHRSTVLYCVVAVLITIILVLVFANLIGKKN